MIAAGEIGAPHFVHGAYLQDWLLQPTDFSWRLEQEKGGKSSAIGDIGSHWCDLVQHVVGQRIEAVLADFQTVIPTRFKPSKNREAFATVAMSAAKPFHVESEDLATVLVRFDGGARGSVCVGQVCAGHKNDLWFEVNGRKASVRWLQERQNELWIGRREAANGDAAQRSVAAGRCRQPLRAPAGRASGSLGRRVLQRNAGCLRIHRERPET